MDHLCGDPKCHRDLSSEAISLSTYPPNALENEQSRAAHASRIHGVLERACGGQRLPSVPEMNSDTSTLGPRGQGTLYQARENG